MNYVHLHGRIFDTPLAIQPSKLEVILQAIGPRLGLVGLEAFPTEAAKTQASAAPKAYSVTRDGIAVIPVQGTIMKKTSGLMAMSGCTSYEALANQLDECMSNPAIKGVLLDIDSPGGEVSGLFDLADKIYNAAETGKPIFAVSNDAAFSAAYAIASCAEKIFLTRTAGVGSVGVFCLHADQSAADAKAGMKYTYIKAGAKKTEGNPHEPLSDTAMSDSQAEVDREYQMFVSLVARNRGVSVQSVIDTEAGCYFGENAVPLLADEIGTFDDALQAITALVAPSAQPALLNNQATQGIEPMRKKSQTEAAKPEIKAEADEEMKKEDAVEPDAAAQAAKPKDDEPDDDEEDDQDESCDPAMSATDLKQIMNLCTLAGVDLKTAAEFINQGHTVADVQKHLLERRAARSSSTKVSTTLPSMGGMSARDRLKAGATPKTTAEEYKRFLKANSEAYAAYLTERYTRG
ncbi:MAG TPA: S49 family peptidase [Bryobacteraceae bacterium]|jgi:signal peptide peptidase SppA